MHKTIYFIYKQLNLPQKQQQLFVDTEVSQKSLLYSLHKHMLNLQYN